MPEPSNSDTILTPLQEIYWEDTENNYAELIKLANYALAIIGGARVIDLMTEN